MSGEINTLKQITKEEAIRIIQAYGSVNEKEKKWFQDDYIEYQAKHGRNLFYKTIISETDFRNLVFNERCDKGKISDFENKFRTRDYQSKSFLCLRDLNTNEEGSFYVENGKHRVQALKNLISRREISFPKIHVIIVCKNELF